MREYALYLFDFDNTLFDTRCGIEAILREALPVLGVEYGPDSFDECLGLTMDQVYDRYMGDDRSRYRDFERSFMSVVMSDAYLGAPPFPETARVLESLRVRGKRIGVVSGKKAYKIVNLLRANGLDGYPETVVGFDETDRHKPLPDPILKGMSSFDVPKDETVYVGDSPNDALAAEAAGVDCVIVDRHNQLSVEGIECTCQVDSLDELILW
ncbi:MAG: hypothetical protein A3205_02155 [Methanomassiliicoccales archaeon Mx-03]|nr:MAG: hypothetical protein A3205_02155 [Methanomassiliicoccales archaeon Mx-03]